MYLQATSALGLFLKTTEPRTPKIRWILRVVRSERLLFSRTRRRVNEYGSPDAAPWIGTHTRPRGTDKGRLLFCLVFTYRTRDLSSRSRRNRNRYPGAF